MATTESWLPSRETTTDPVDPLATDVDSRLVVVQEPAPEGPVRRRLLPEWWPVMAAIAGWPVWWLLGLTPVVFTLTAIPLAWSLHKRRRIQLPPGFWIWLLFLALVLISGFALDVAAEGTRTNEGVGRYFAFLARFANYASITVMMLFVINLREDELPRRRVAGWLASLGAVTVGLGLLALVLPNLQFPSPFSLVLPDALTGSGAVRLAQVQPVLGDPSPRPAAPFAYTNAWGCSLSLLLVWVAVAWGAGGRRRHRVLLAIVGGVAIVPIVFSLNRGMWIGIILTIVVVGVRLALRGRAMVLAASGAALTVTIAVLALTPLSSLIESRTEEGHSNDIRSSLAQDAMATADQSPVIGFGSTRTTIGSADSIAIGPSDDCPLCGGRDIGSTGQLTLLLIAQGYLGVALYVGYFAYTLVAFARDLSPIGLGGTIVVALNVFYGFFYSALTIPLAVTMLSIALLYRNDKARRAGVVRT